MSKLDKEPPNKEGAAEWYARGFRDGREHVQEGIKRALGIEDKKNPLDNYTEQLDN